MKVRVSVAGQVIETTLAEIKEVFQEQVGDSFTEAQLDYLAQLRRRGTIQFQSHAEKVGLLTLLRPLRNAGLIHAVPRTAPALGDATGVQLSALGRLYLRARSPERW
jgi:hypothetical protein